jgi:hypothetical protein
MLSSNMTSQKTVLEDPVRLSRSLGLLTLLVALLTVAWVIMMLLGELTTASGATLVDRVNAIEDHRLLFALNYANAGLLTLACVAMLGGFYAYTRGDSALWSAVAMLFVPIYGVCNALVYLSQVFVVPQLLDLYHDPQTAVLGETWLRLVLHTWPGSAASFVNALAYAILAIPSIIFGLLLARGIYGARLGGLLLVASGLLSVVALAGLVFDEEALALLSPASGFVFLLGLLALSFHFLRASAPSDHRPQLALDGQDHELSPVARQVA